MCKHAAIGRLMVLYKIPQFIQYALYCGTPLPTGLSNPFVELTLMPPWQFGHTQSKKQKTPVKKKTVNPVFNEDFIM